MAISATFATTLEEAVEQAGSPVKMLWKPGAPPWKPPVVPDQFDGWRKEQRAWIDSVALSDLSHHMRDLFVDGPDATRLLSEVSANDYQHFEIGQAKQFVPVTAAGDIVTDGILMRDAEDAYTLSGPPASQSWVLWHGQAGNYEVEFRDDPDSEFRRDGDPVLCRYQVQGPAALDLVAKAFGGPLPETKFFHSTPATLDGRTYRAFRHGMAGQPGYEFIGNWEDGEALRTKLVEAGEEFDLVQVGALAYSTNGIESGWIPTPTPGIYTDPSLKPYRESLRFFSYEGQKPLKGSFFSEDIEDYYTTPWELGYGRSIAFNHDFFGREALERRRDEGRTKVTLVLDPGAVKEVFGADLDFFLTYGRYRIEADGELVGLTFYTGHIDPLGTILALSLIDPAQAEPGTKVELVYGEHPGPGNDPDGDFGFARIPATVHASPYNQFARDQYRRD